MGDLRVSIGLYFSLVGIILLIVGIADPGARAPLTDFNVNLYSGASVLAFGSVMLWLGRRSS